MLEKAGFRHLPDVVGQTAILINDDPLTHGLSIIKTGTDHYADRLNFTQFAGMQTLTSQVWKRSERLRPAWIGDCGAHPEWAREANTPWGTDGSMYHPNLKEGERLVVLQDDLLRKITLSYAARAEFLGFDAFKYTVAPETFATTAEHPPNCAYSNDAPSGTFNVTSYKNAPVHMSKPFFLDADPSYRAGIDGLPVPDPAKHDMVFWLEPKLGIPLQEMKRAQINFHIHPQKHWPMTAALRPEGFFSPLAFTEESVTLPEGLRSEIMYLIEGSHVLAMVIRYGGLVSGSLLSGWCVVLIYRRCDLTRRARRTDYPTEEDPLLQ